MKVRATTVSRYFDSIRNAWCMSGRIEIQGTADGQWTNLGIQHYSEYDWLLIVSLMVAGARATGVELVHDTLN